MWAFSFSALHKLCRRPGKLKQLVCEQEREDERCAGAITLSMEGRKEGDEHECYGWSECASVCVRASGGNAAEAKGLERFPLLPTERKGVFWN